MINKIKHFFERRENWICGLSIVYAFYSNFSITFETKCMNLFK